MISEKRRSSPLARVVKIIARSRLTQLALHAPPLSPRFSAFGKDRRKGFVKELNELKAVCSSNPLFYHYTAKEMKELFADFFLLSAFK